MVLSSWIVPTLLTTTAIAGLVGWRYRHNQHRFKALTALPSPPKHPLWGNIPAVLRAVKQKQFFQLLWDWSKQNGPMYVYWVGSSPVLMLAKAKLIEDTIITGMRDGQLVRSDSVRQAWNDISGPILLGLEGEDWKWRRKAWNPEFTATSVARYAEMVGQACQLISQRIEQAPAGKPVEVDPLFVELTMRVIAYLLLGIPLDPQHPTPEGPPLVVPEIEHAMSVIAYRFLRVATGERTWQKYLPTQAARDYWAARKTLEAFLLPRAELAMKLRDGEIKTTDSRVSDLFQSSLLVRVISKEPRYTQGDLLAEMVELLIAGTDTTAHSLSFAVGELASHPEIFQKAQRIVDQVYAKYGNFHSVASLTELTYIRAIFKETLRLYSIASGSTSLQVVRPLAIDDITIPVGTKIFWSMLAAGRDPESYPNPDEFRPERWLAEEQGSPSLPMIDFGSGAHRCLGEQLAMLEATVMLAELLRQFTWELVNGRASLENLQQNLLIYPPDKMPLRFTLR
ncbi:MAG: hypothetical protein RLZZ490_276 [Cyanobacteriota bacterium]